ncbi:DNA replication protein [Bacillus thuringiensis]|uniref:ATP-binding protein n=1 Tax=Bacillus thuringiensis TaxID=1428 RepID=UPI000BEC99DC|nr:ATP-binding protein [Bacillus thuringiensis]PEF03543.1 DNA replication protein [Bacillus thuringiensis]PFI26696.1 DNA replication protein [Bacillus thuringiensis]PFP70029.1 DNA replication protein [Bacillus thuringiensis]
MTLKDKCELASRCKIAGNELRCNETCFPYVLTHGLNGNRGLWNSTKVPNRYRQSFLRNLPIQGQNPTAYSFIKIYIEKVLTMVEQGVGLYLYSMPSPTNRMGTGTGKTTVATAIVNEFILERIIQHAKGENKITNNPALFLKASELQNTYNAQFRGTDEMKTEASKKYYALKEMMLKTELLVIDDIALRNTTQAYQDEFYEVIDRRYNNEQCTIFTSNTPVEEIGQVLNYQIASRVEGMTEQVLFKGDDNRKGGIL